MFVQMSDMHTINVSLMLGADQLQILMVKSVDCAIKLESAFCSLDREMAKHNAECVAAGNHSVLLKIVRN